MTQKDTPKIICKTQDEARAAIETIVSKGKIIVLDFEDASWLFKGMVIPKWAKFDTSKVTHMAGTFEETIVCCDLTKLDTSKVVDMFQCFFLSSFNQDISIWDCRKVLTNEDIFKGCSIAEKFKPKFEAISNKA